jgi:lysophospholipase L1-like esterase
MGISGNTTRDLKARWQTDVVDLKPDWVSIMIGANDVWRQYDSPKQTERHVLIDEYERNLVELVTLTKPLVKGLVLMTPFYLEPNRQDPMRATMDRYAAVVRRVAAAQSAVLVDTQAAFDKVLEVYYPATINWDRVHPNPTGSAVLARAFLSSVGFDWSRGL